MTISLEEMTQDAYAAYRQALGDPTAPAWDALDPAWQEAWRAAAQRMAAICLAQMSQFAAHVAGAHDADSAHQ